MVKEALMYVIVAVAIWAIVAIVSPLKGVLVGKVAYGAFTKAIEIIIAVFLIIGLVQVWISSQTLSKILGKEAGWKGLILASTIPLFIGGSLLTIFPLLKTLRDKGASIACVMAFIVAWSGKAPLLPLEIEFLGWKFAILRFALIVPFAILMGLVSELLLEKPGKRHLGGETFNAEERSNYRKKNQILNKGGKNGTLTLPSPLKGEDKGEGERSLNAYST